MRNLFFNKWSRVAIGLVLMAILSTASTNSYAVPIQYVNAKGNPIDVKKRLKANPDRYIEDMKTGLRHGDMGRVCFLSRHLLEIAPQNVDVSAMFAICLASKKQMAKSRNQIELLDKPKSQNKFAKYANAMVLRAEKQLDNALKVCNEAIAMDPSHPYPLNIKGHIHMDRKKYFDALVYFKKSVDLEPKFVLGYANLGAVMLITGSKEEAYKYYSKALSLNQNLPSVHYGLALLYEGFGNNLKAIEALEQCIQLDPNNKEAVTRLENLKAKVNE